MAKQIIENGDKGLAARTKINGNFTELYDADDIINQSLAEKASINHNHDGVYEPANDNIQEHIFNTSNPHSVTKNTIGLGNVDNTSDADKPISTATQLALNDKSNVGHTHTTSEVNGLGTAATKDVGTSADNVIVLDIDQKLPAVDASQLTEVSHLSSDVEDALNAASSPSSTNPYATQNEISATGDMHKTTYDPRSKEADVYLMDNMDEGNNTKIMTAQERADIALNSQKIGITQEQADDIEEANSHIINTSNPHFVTKAQVGLGNVDNTSDMDKPISTAVQTALDTKSELLVDDVIFYSVALGY